jgi:hypothetical protein
MNTNTNTPALSPEVLARVREGLALRGEDFRRFLDAEAPETFSALPEADFRRYLLRVSAETGEVSDALADFAGEEYGAASAALRENYARKQALAGLRVRSPYAQALAEYYALRVRRLERARSLALLGTEERPSRQVPIVFAIAGLRERPSAQAPAL